MFRSHHARLVTQRIMSPIKAAIYLFVCGWLMLMQPGMSLYSVISPELHAEIDEELYGQTIDGHTLPGHAEHAPHDHPVNQASAVPGGTHINPFDAAFYYSLLAPALRPALRGQRLESDVIVQSISIEPPEQPPRA